MVEVLSSQVSVPVRGQDLKDAIIDCQNTDIEGAATKVVDEDVALSPLLLQTIGYRSRRWLVYNPSNIQTRYGPCILSCLPLGIIEISCSIARNSNINLTERQKENRENKPTNAQ